MSTAPAAQQAASDYIRTTLSGTVRRLDFIGMTMTPHGRRVGFEVEWDRGTSVVGALGGAALVGVVALLLSIFFGLLLALVGVPPGLLSALGLLVTAGGIFLGGRTGADASEIENLTVTVDDTGTIVMANRELSPGEFSSAIDRDYDRETRKFGEIISEVSRQVLLHRLISRYLGPGKNN